MKVLQLLIVIALVSTTLATRQVRTCNGNASASVGTKVFMGDCPARDSSVQIYDCGEANTGGTWMDCQLVADEDFNNTPGALNAQSIVEDYCDDDDDYKDGKFWIITSEGFATDQLCLTAIKHDSTTSFINFCNNLDSSLYHSIENSKGMCEEPQWTNASEYGRLIFGETDSYTMGYAYLLEKSQDYRELNVVRAVTNEPDGEDYFTGTYETRSFITGDFDF